MFSLIEKNQHPQDENNIDPYARNQESEHLKVDFINQIHEIEKQIINIILEFVKLDNIESQHDNIVIKNLKDFGLDSLDITEIVMSIESEFDIHFSEKDYDKLSSIKDIAKFILEKK